MNKSVKNLLPQLVMALFGLVLLIAIPQQIMDNTTTGVGPRFFPIVIAVSIIVLSLGSVITTLFKKTDNSSAKEKKEHNPSKSYGRVILIFIGITAWCILLPLTGFVLTTLLVTIYFMFMIGNRNKMQMIVVPLLFTGALYYLVEYILILSFPERIFL